MKKTVLILTLILFSSPAGASIITFDPTFPSIPSDVTVQYFNGGLTGPLSSLPAAIGESLASAISAVPSGGNALLLYNSTWQFGPYGVLFTFDSLQATVSAVGNDWGGDPVTDNEIVHLTAFDSSGNLIGSASSQGLFAEPHNLQPVTFSSALANIKYIAFTWQNDLGYYMVDNVEYESRSVPEPASLALLAVGFFGLRLLRKKR